LNIGEDGHAYPNATPIQDCLFFDGMRLSVLNDAFLFQEIVDAGTYVILTRCFNSF
jgi:hypothetical protein